MALPKPVMRGLLTSYIKKHVTIAIILSVMAGFSYKYGVMEPRKRRIAAHYSTYDAEADFERMKHLGYFQSVQEE